jgi:hypothetical protein
MSNSSNENLILEEKYPPRSLTEVANIDLSFIKESWCADMLRDAMKAVVLAQGNADIIKNEIDVWNYLSIYEPPVSEGFMFSRGDNVISCIQSNLQDGHSGNTMAMTMRQLQLLAKIGLSKYREGYCT